MILKKILSTVVIFYYVLKSCPITCSFFFLESQVHNSASILLNSSSFSIIQPHLISYFFCCNVCSFSSIYQITSHIGFLILVLLFTYFVLPSNDTIIFPFLPIHTFQLVLSVLLCSLIIFIFHFLTV